MTKIEALEWAQKALEDISSDPHYTDDDEFCIIENEVLPMIQQMMDEISNN